MMTGGISKLSIIKLIIRCQCVCYITTDNSLCVAVNNITLDTLPTLVCTYIQTKMEGKFLFKKGNSKVKIILKPGVHSKG